MTKPIRLRSFIIPLLAAVVACLVGNGDARATGRVALVLGTDTYAVLGSSTIDVKRVTAIRDSLAGHGFEVVFAANPSNAVARARLAEFADKADGADIALAVLAGHAAGLGGQAFFLPANADVGRSADLLSRGLSIGNVAQITARATVGGVIALVTAPKFKAPVAGLDVRPLVTGEVPANSFVAISTSPTVPVSQVDTASGQAADAMLAVLSDPAPRLDDVVSAIAGGSLGTVVGKAASISLEKPAPQAEPAATEPVAETAPPPAAAAPSAASAGAAESEAKRAAREEAEAAVAAERQRTEQARTEAERAQAEVEQARAEAEKAKAAAEIAKAEAEKARAEADKAIAEAQKGSAAAPAPPAEADTALLSETDLGRRQRQLIQERLKALSLYTGPVDGIMGPLTREAIMGFQKARKAAVTGYLTPDQYDTLVGTAD